MKNSNFDLLINRYVTGKTSAQETLKIEALLEGMGKRKIQFLSKETEEFFFRKITNARITPDEINLLVKSLSKLKIPGIEWLGVKPLTVYFNKRLY